MKKKKARKQKTRKKLEEYFKCPIWFADVPEFVKSNPISLNKLCDVAPT